MERRTKKEPTHDLPQIQARFVDVDSLEITNAAKASARALGFGLNNVVAAVQQDLRRGHFVKSEPPRNPPMSGVWHDTYTMRWRGFLVYVKFAGATIVDIVLTSFKEK
jgi:motility quorum-sensing regulator/GCU-specific mRNA interferase toxin